MEEAKQQIVERLKQANNVLVTVSRDPSVDQLAAAIGLALFLNKINKHASAVFSGRIPPVLEFLQPEKTIEKNTDSLRDFIIALDKSKADKLRYKVEDEHVKIFITPYRTSISQEDLEFSQGDFNVDVVIALGVQEQKDLDQAITVHGRILHDATVASLSLVQGASLGTMNWVQAGASSLCEMVEGLIEGVKPNTLDGQMSTALLTGIVAETVRFSNDKTTAATMSVSSKLLAAGANQQLVAESLAPKPAPPPPPPPPPTPTDQPFEPSGEQGAQPQRPVDSLRPAQNGGFDLPAVQPVEEQKPADGALYISHESGSEETTDEEPEEQQVEQIHIDEQGELHPMGDSAGQPQVDSLPQIVMSPPALGSAPAATDGADMSSSTDLPAPSAGERHLLNHNDNPFGVTPQEADDQPLMDPMGFMSGSQGAAPVAAPTQAFNPMFDQQASTFAIPGQQPVIPPATSMADDLQQPEQPVSGDTQTLTDLEQAVSSPHVQSDLQQSQPMEGAPSADAARDAVNEAMNNGSPAALPPITALNAQPVAIGLPGDQPPMPVGEPIVPPAPVQSEPMTSDFSFPDHLIKPTDPSVDNTQPPSMAPPVPPPMPMMPGFGGASMPGRDDVPPSGVPFPPPKQPPVGF